MKIVPHAQMIHKKENWLELNVTVKQDIMITHNTNNNVKHALLDAYHVPGNYK